MRNARHNKDIAVANPRRTRHAIGDQVCPIGHPRHPQPCLGQPAARFIIGFKRGARLRMNNDINPKRLGNRIDGDVIMRRANPASGEQIVIAHPQRIDRADNLILNIGHDAHFAQTNALNIKPQRNLGDIFILCPARQNFIADDCDGGGIDTLVHKRLL